MNTPNRTPLYKYLLTTGIFLLVNFAALAIGGIFTSNGVNSDWFLNLKQAPWNPPGWVFGAAWTLIMICFAFYMSALYYKLENTKFILNLFILQWILNVAWNPTFFYFHYTLLALFVILALTILVAYFYFTYRNTLKLYSLLILPYLIWLCIATSLNAYIFFTN